MDPFYSSPLILIMAPSELICIQSIAKTGDSMTNTETLKLALTNYLGQRMDEFRASETQIEGELEKTQVSFILSSWTDADLVGVLESLLKRGYLMDGWMVGGLLDDRLSVTIKVVYSP